MKEETKFWIETTLKIVGLLIGSFAIFKYFNDQSIQRDTHRKDAAIQYISEYRSEDNVTKRLQLANFWLDNPRLANMVSSRSVTGDNYRNLFIAVANARPPGDDFWQALLVQTMFFEEVAICHQQGQCDAETIEAFFCTHARTSSVAFGPALDILGKRFGNSDFGAGVRYISKECPDEDTTK